MDRVGQTPDRCGRPEDMDARRGAGVLFANDQQWELLTSPDYPNYKLVHVHRWFEPFECSLIATADKEPVQ